MPRTRCAAAAAFALGALALVARPGAADVSPRNGNFFTKYTDVSFPGGLEPKIERVYNSKTGFRGIFGWGWGNEYESYLDVLGDGTVALHEHGGGAENFFVPPALSGREIDLSVEQLAAARAGETAMSADSSIAYRARLRNDASYRSSEWTRLVRSGKVTPRVLPVGTRLRSMRFGLDDMVKTADGYRRITDGFMQPSVAIDGPVFAGRAQFFDAAGRLVRITKGKAWIALTRDDRGRMTALTDNIGRAVRFEYNDRGLVTRLSASDSTSVRYTYDSRDDLVQVSGADTVRFTYDARHNMTRIATTDDEAPTVIAYHPASLSENVHSVASDNKTETYEYATDPQNPLRTVVRITTVRGDDTTLTVNEYTMRRRANGDEWTERVVTTVGTKRTDAYYSECCGLPVTIIVNNRDTTTFQYDREGHITRKETRTTLDSLAYDPALGKTALIVRRVKGSDERHWTTFAYDVRGNLTKAENYEGQFVRLHYNDDDKIVAMDGKEQTLRFAYNDIGKPVRIETDSGYIVVTYKPNGEIDKVDSPKGHRMALLVTQAFQNLLALVNMKDLSVCRVSFTPAVCAGVEKPLRHPDSMAPGKACGAGESRCPTGALRKRDEIAFALLALAPRER